MIIKPVRPAVAAAVAAVTGAVAVILAVVLTATGVAAPAARAETAACGSTCADLSPLSTGTADVLSVTSSTGLDGGTIYSVILRATSATNSTEDWSMAKLGTVSQFFDAGLIGKVTDTFWSGDQVYEIQYTPSGTPSGNCMSSPGALSTSVTLSACGTSASTLWIADTAAETSNAVPLINGTSESFSEPEVLTAGNVGGALSVNAMLVGGASSTPSSNQLWLISFGQL